MKKQMGYADNNHIPYVAIVGGDEMAQQKVMLKNMTTGEQEKVPVSAIVEKLKNA